MARLFERSKMPFWYLKIHDIDHTQFLRNNIESMGVEYEINKPSHCEIVINSKSYIEDFFMEGSNVEIGMGFGLTSMVQMFKGKVTVTPEGSASDHIGYTIIANSNIGDMGAAKHQRVFSSGVKSQIINTLIAENGFNIAPLSVSIADNKPLPADQIPIQRNMTDLEFMMDCAKRWHCVMWYDEKTRVIYFYDADKAHSQGNNLRVPSQTDVDLIYKLGYRSEINNIANIKWGFDKTQGTGQSITGKDENGVDVVIPEDIRPYSFDRGDVIYVLKPEYRHDAKLLGQLTTLALKSAIDQDTFNSTKHAFTPVKIMERTNADKSSNAAYASRGLKIDIELNIGDLNLRPPRQCTIKSGVNNSRADSANLPAFIRQNTLHNINKVKTSISSGKIATSLGITL